MITPLSIGDAICVCVYLDKDALWSRPQVLTPHSAWLMVSLSYTDGDEDLAALFD